MCSGMEHDPLSKEEIMDLLKVTKPQKETRRMSE